MPNSLTNNRPSKTATTAAIPAICVVDSQTADYQAWRELAERHEIELHFLASPTEALRHARTHHVDLWVVNTELSGVGGCELCGMLKTQAREVNVYLVADRYSEAAERSAWAARATMFDPKPLHIDRLATWLAHRRKQRAGVRQSVASHAVATR